MAEETEAQRRQISIAERLQEKWLSHMETLLDSGLPVWLSFRRCRHGVCGVYGQHWGPFAAGSLMAMIPVTALFLFLQRWIVSGLTAGSVKG